MIMYQYKFYENINSEMQNFYINIAYINIIKYFEVLILILLIYQVFYIVSIYHFKIIWYLFKPILTRAELLHSLR